MASFDVETTGADVVKALGNDAAGKIILITGPSKNGIGAEIAKTLASANPGQLLLAGRNGAKVDPVIKEIQETNPEVNVTFIQCELSDDASVREAAAKINSLIGRLDVLINNAGIMAVRSFEKSVDGVESQFAAGCLGHFLLTNLIMDKIVAAKDIVINMTSSAYTLDEVNTEDPNFEVGEQPKHKDEHWAKEFFLQEGRNYNPWNAYARTKTAGILFAVAIADKFGTKGVTSFAVDPGMVKGTILLVSSGVDGDLMKQGIDMAVVRNGGEKHRL